MKKSENIFESLTVAVILSLSGGFMDAYSYVCRGQVFANAQTGNILLFGVHLSTGDFIAALRYACPVTAFAAGIAAADILRHILRDRKNIHWHQMAVLTEALILFAVAFIPQNFNLLANSLTSFACGIQVESFRKVNGVGIATTMCIGNLRTAVQSLCSYRFEKIPVLKENSLLYFGIIAIFTLGAVIGNICVEFLHEKAIIVSTVLLMSGYLIMHSNQREKL